MVLLDTSVWIRHWRAIEPYRTHVDRLLETQQVLAHEFVYGELLGWAPAALHGHKTRRAIDWRARKLLC